MSAYIDASPAITVPLTVRASGSVAGGVAPHFKLLVDGQAVGDASVPGSDATDFTFDTALDPAAAHSVEVVYDNDAVVNGQDRNLFVQSIAVNGQSIAASGSQAVYHATGLGDILGSGDMWWGGALEFTVPACTSQSTPAPTGGTDPSSSSASSAVPATPAPAVSGGTSTGTTSIAVRASGSVAGGVAPHFNLLVDGQVVGDSSVPGSDPSDYSFTAVLDPAAAHSVQVVYDNDGVVNGQDRNLFVQSITVNGPSFPANGSQAVYHATGQGDILGSGSMWWGGALEFSVPAGTSAAPMGSSAPPASAPPASAPSVTAPPVTSPTPTSSAFFVAVSGDDNGDGSAAHPFASIGRAQAAMEHSATHTTYVEGGTYNLAATVTLGNVDSGMSFLADPGQTPILDGAAAHLGTLVQVNGASNVTFSGLSFAHGGNGQAALSLTGSTGLQVVGNHFAGNGTAILLTGSSGNTVSGNEIDDSAQSAVEAKDGSNGNVFDSNVINGTGAPGEQGGGFFLHGVNNNAITHNLVQNTAGMGIGIANWDDTTINVGNTISYNIVKNTNMNSVDSGAIYMLGRSHVDTKSTISNNLIDNTGAGGDAHTVGIYLDDSTSGVLVEGNIVRDIGTHGAQIHGGDNIMIRNNIFDLGSGQASAVLFQAAPADTNPTNTMQNNHVVGNIIQSSSGSPNLFSYLAGGTPDITRNLYYNVVGALMGTSGPTTDTNPSFGNPNFADATAGDYRLGTGSAAAATGFQGIDQTQMGPRPTTPSWNAAR